MPSIRRFGAFVALVSLVATGEALATSSGIDPGNLDRAVSPKSDFYRFAVGGWLARNSIPSDRTSWGAFDELAKRNERRLIGILHSPGVTDARVGSEARKVGDVYAACTDVDGVERDGLRALQPALGTIAAIRSTHDLSNALARAFFAGSDAAFGFGPEQDFADARRTIVGLSQGGLTLPTRDYYFSNAPRSKEIRAAFAREVRATFRLLGEDQARAARDAATVLTIETRLARASKTPDALRDPVANFHPMPLARLETLAPHVAWSAFFATSGLGPAARARIDVSQPEFFRGFDALVATLPLEMWKPYLRWHQVATSTVALPRAYRDIAFAFDRTFTGQPIPTPRDKTCARLVDRTLGFALGKLYVAKYFPPSAKARAKAEVDAVKAALRDDIEHVAWMGPQTRVAALAKLAKLQTSKVGYPDRPRSYASLAISRASLLADVLASDRFEFARNLAKIGKPVDRSEWGLTPQTVNAYYDPSMNEIVVPAGILEPPFFNANADDATNFGAIGAVIGHELTHGFDDEGSNFDGDGNLHPVVTKADSAKFHARVACIVAQADAFVVPGLGLHLNGKLDAGEAAADIGGTTIAYRALRAARGDASPAPGPAGFKPDQRFFLSWAQVWREKLRRGAERAQVLGDPHPVGIYRVDATLANEKAFDTAFGIAPGDPMYRAPKRRCTIW